MQTNRKSLSSQTLCTPDSSSGARWSQSDHQSIKKTLGNKNSPIFISEEYNFFATKKTGLSFFKDTLGRMKLIPCRMPPIKRLFQAKTILSNNEGNDIFDFSQFQIQKLKNCSKTLQEKSRPKTIEEALDEHNLTSSH